MCARMRKKKNIGPRMERVASLLVADPAAEAGAWRSLFDDLPFDIHGAPLHVEIGCGKGSFVFKKAQAEPGTLFVAVEKVTEAIVMAMEKALEAGIRNVRFVNGDAGAIADWFAPGEVSALYVNFCDPWPKKGNAKRRLTHSVFLSLYERILAPGGDLHFKTDNRGLFEFSLNELSGYGLILRDICFDLHATDLPNHTTEYEDKFTAAGMPIYHLTAKFPSLLKKEQ